MEGKVRRTRMLGWTLEFLTGTCDTEEAGMGFDLRIGIPGMCHLTAKEMTSFFRAGKLISQASGGCWLPSEILL